MEGYLKERRGCGEGSVQLFLEVLEERTRVGDVHSSITIWRTEYLLLVQESRERLTVM